MADDLTANEPTRSVYWLPLTKRGLVYVGKIDVCRLLRWEHMERMREVLRRV